MDRNEQIQTMKREYREIQAPQNGYERIQESIERGKREAKRRRRLTVYRNCVTGAAMVIFLAVLLPNLNAYLARSMEKLPVLGVFFKAVTVREYHEENMYYPKEDQELYLASQTAQEEPVIAEVEKSRAADSPAAGENDGIEAAMPRDASREAAAGQTDQEAAAGQTSQKEAEYVEMLLDYFQLEREESGEDYLGLDITYEVRIDNDDWFTLVIDAAEPQADGGKFSRFYTIDKTCGERVELKDLFFEGADYISVISEEVRRQMKAAMEADPEQIYWLWDGQTDGFYEIREDQNFYLNDHGDLVIVFDEGEVAPESYGSPEFVINQEFLK